MKATQTKPKIMLGRVLARLLLMLGGVALALALLLLLLRAFPSLVPAALRPPLDGRSTNQTLTITYTEIDGDIFYNLPGDVRPPEGEPAVLSQHVLRTDENGFRIPALTAPTYADYPIVALGDSFTDAWMVAEPWTDVLAAALDKPVLNLAYRGYGPVEEEAVLREFASDQTGREWVLVAFFEGNDLQNIVSSRLSQFESEGEVFESLIRRALQPRRFEVVENPDGQYRYPLALYIGSAYYEAAFFDPYLWILNAERETYEQSRNLSELSSILGEMREHSEGACLGVVYLPTKEHIYFRYAEQYGRRWILEDGRRSIINDDGWLVSWEVENVDFEAYIRRMSNQRDAIQALVEEDLGLPFFDLTPAFLAAAEAEQMLYLTYDTHWNQDGHRLAGETVAEMLRQNPTCERG